MVRRARIAGRDRAECSGSPWIRVITSTRHHGEARSRAPSPTPVWRPGVPYKRTGSHLS